jgi:hypothetical protein
MNEAMNKKVVALNVRRSSSGGMELDPFSPPIKTGRPLIPQPSIYSKGFPRHLPDSESGAMFLAGASFRLVQEFQ